MLRLRFLSVLVLLALSAAGHLAHAGTTASGPPGYVPDGDCTPCHSSIATSFREVAMAQAFARPTRENAGGPLGEVFVHAPSAQRFSMTWRDETLVFRRWQVAADGTPIHELEIPVDWVLGSGRHSRSYLYRTPSGELWQLPIAWYAETGRFGMSPGFDRPDHDGVMRRVRRECIACHAAYPAVEPGGDARWAPHRFPAELGEGIGCQRCHGPGGEHTRRAWADTSAIAAKAAIREAIVNPRKLPRERRDEVCYQCHLQPSVALPGIARAGEGDFAFRPGDRLADRRILVEVEEDGRSADARFEINHHAYRLRRSRCFVASGGALACVDCHDPHRRPAPAELAARVRGVCLGCHVPEAASAPAHAEATADCASCHLPKRRAQDVVHTVMTDHAIARRPPGPEAVAPLAEREPTVTGVGLYGSDSGSPGGELDRLIAVVRLAGGASPEGVRRLAARLAARLPEAPPPSPELWLDLASGELGSRRFAEAEAAIGRVLAVTPDEPQALEWLGLARAGQGDGTGAVEALRRALAAGGSRPEAEYNLGRLLLARGETAAAVPHLERALALRPNLAVAAYHLGRARLALGEREAAVAALERALAWDPRHTGAVLALAEARLAAGERGAALRLLRHGAEHAGERERVRARLAEVEGAGAK